MREAVAANCDMLETTGAALETPELDALLPAGDFEFQVSHQRRVQRFRFGRAIHRILRPDRFGVRGRGTLGRRFRPHLCVQGRLRDGLARGGACLRAIALD